MAGSDTAPEGRSRQSPARMLPITEWNVAEIAQGSAVNGVKCLVASTEPSPEFCIPTSMEMVRQMTELYRRRRANR